MTYGVDECRVCGKRITPKGPEVMERHLASLKDKRVTMTEKQWRAAGFKAMPTKRQMTIRHEGCCFDCAYRMGLSNSPARRFVLPAIGALLLLYLTFVVVGSVFL